MKRKMSRFVLRSNAEQTKLSEQKEKSKSLANTLKTPTKKADNKKTINKNCTAPKGPIQQTPTTPVKCQTSSASAATIESDEVDEQHDGRISIICSLPLSRLSGIIEKLSIKAPQKHDNDAQVDVTPFTKPPIQTSTAQGIDQCADDDDGDEKHSVFDDDTSNSKSHDQEIMIKTLCLYCDKQFNTQKMQQKHIEKFHSPQKDRRCSVRNSQVLASPRSKSAIRLSAKNYPGCTYCKKLKQHESTDPVQDFNGLFLHLTEQHADKYFGCKICIMRFQNIGKLIKHMQLVHNTLPEAQLKLSKDFEISEETRIEPDSPPSPADKPQQQTKQLRHSMREHESPASSSLLDQSDVIGAEDTILTRLGLTQNRRRMPSNRKGVRLRRDTAVPDMLLKSEGLMSSSATTALLAASPSKSRSKVTSKSSIATGSSDPDAVVFRVPARTCDASSAVFDENFYKEVTANVRNNLLFHLDGKLEDTRNSHTTEQLELLPSSSQTKSLPSLLRSTLAPTMTVQENLESNLQETEIHVATNLTATTAFPTLLTAEQYCGDARKIRRPHTKHSWKWKWDSVKKYKLINEGGKMVKKAKHPMLGLRDLSKLDMWTQLSMRQKHEKQLIALQNASNFADFPSGEKRRLNDQLNAILDTRVLPHIILEQSEQAIIKLENDEFNFSATNDERNVEGRDDDDFYAGSIVGQTFADESFLSLLQLLPRCEIRNQDRKLVLSGEWARPRCYMCMCCGNRFEKLKSLEEHKTFRHSNIFSTHYEVVGRELLAGNLLQYLFIPKRALSYYSAPPAPVVASAKAIVGSAKKLMKYRRINVAAEEESSDSVQSVSNSYAPEKRAFSLKNIASTTDDCDTDTKTTLLGDINTVSPSHSLQSTFSSSLTANSNQSGGSGGVSVGTSGAVGSSQIKLTENSKESTTRNWNCSKCSRKCNGMSDLYRHMLDCSGDYIWSLAKKRKYRYYCGSKKRRHQLHRQHSSESRKNKPEKTSKSQTIENCTTEESSSNSYKPKTPPRPRPSDAESIKKMLENLPPKRVCKTIFPTVNKAKKTKKPKFITKLYNTRILRTTRARQISNKRLAAKAKKASQNKTLNSIKCRSRKSICPTKQSSNTANSETATTTDADTKADNDNVPPMAKQSSPKKELASGSLPQEDLSQISNKIVSNDKTEVNKLPNRATSKLTVQKETAKVTMHNENVGEKKDTKNVSAPAENATEKEMSVEENNTTTNADENDQQKCSKATSQSVDTSACNRKRSKRISDCIAMLTGKLEEKLKTESTTIVNARNDESLESSESKTAATEKEKKTPKRKTISRRIIKTDLVDVSDAPADVPDSASMVATTTTTTLVATTLVVTAANATTGEKTTKLTTATATTSTRTTTKIANSSVKCAVTASAKSIKEPPIAAPPSVPAKVVLPPPVTPTLVPIPMPLATALHAVPVPLKVLQGHLPVFLPPQNLQAAPVALPAPIPVPAAPTAAPALPLALPLTLTNPSAPVALLPPAPITLLGPPPLLQAHISPVSTTSTTPLCSMEPLNLTSTKGAKKQTTAELRAQRPGLPARRQTICGFEARDLLAYNDMEPLDLSLKSRAKPAEPSPTCLVAMKSNYAPIDFNTVAQVTATTSATKTNLQAEELILKPSNSIAQTPIAALPLPPLPPQTALPATATENLFNKQFYSNLELLKIPQIRAAGFLPNVETLNTLTNGLMNASATGAAPTQALTLPTVTVTCSNVNEILPPLTQTQLPAQFQPQPQPQPSPQTQAQPQKTSNKKRGNSKTNNLEPSSNAAVPLTPTKTKETNAAAKKESNAKQKIITKMDEVVNNHIDDAINSVINAVKASLYETEQLQKQQMLLDAKLEPTTPTALSTEPETTASNHVVTQKVEATAPSLIAPIIPAATLVETPITTMVKVVEPTTSTTTADAELFNSEIKENPTTTTTKTTTAVIAPIISTITTTAATTAEPIISTSTSAAATISTTTTAAITEPKVSAITATIEPTITSTKASNEPIKSLPAATLVEPANLTTAPEPSTLKTTPTTNEVEVLKPSLVLTPKKRNLRSKTLDCRSQLKESLARSSPNRNELLSSPLPRLPAVKLTKKQENALNKQLAKTKALENQQQTDKLKDNKNETEKPKKISAEAPSVASTDNNTKLDIERSNDKTKANEDTAHKKLHETKKQITETSMENAPKRTVEVTAATTAAAAVLQDTSMHVNLVTPEENISNMINNTSSGFHSSSTPENAGDVKKKQRRRRKNELAAIVADQLLESFKIDKARRDSLKKLENMAYEKSEDLLITGMLLMSSTKRTASSAVSFNQNAEKRNENAKRQKQQETPTNTNATRPKSRIGKAIIEPKSAATITAAERSSVNDTVQETVPTSKELSKAKDSVEVEEVEEVLAPVRRGRRGRPARRKGGVKTPLDNENLSKLKSSLESFSIGIEKQLNEFEARNTAATKNMFNSVDSKTKKKSPKTAAAGKAVETAATAGGAGATTTTKPPTNSYILRPSILAATLEQAQAATKEEATKSPKDDETKTKNTKETKTATTTASTYSRDPRLNKNIHKDENPELANAKNSASAAVAAAATSNCDIEDDNYLTEIAKNVNEKIMAAENEDFAFADDDGFEIGTEFNDDDDDSNSKYSRPPTSMSVRSAPNFNDDHSNFGSMCDENTNTEVMDMDLDDELSVYTSFSQDLGRGRGRKRRRRRSILLKRRPKKRRSSQDLPAEKFECDLCKKTFFAATSLAKHNMTLAHVSKVSEREYLMSKAGGKAALFNDHFANIFPKKRTTSTAAARRKRAQSMNLEIYERPSFFNDDDDDNDNEVQPVTNVEPNLAQKSPTPPIQQIHEPAATSTPRTTTQQPHQQISSQRLSMNPDERLFYECCNILKSADTTRMATRTEQENENQNSFLYPKAFGPPPPSTIETSTPIAVAAAAALTNKINAQSIHENLINLLPTQSIEQKLQNSSHCAPIVPKQQEIVKAPVLRPSSLQKVLPQASITSTIERHNHSPTYSQFSAVTNTTQSRFKTKAAMKGYENGNVDLTLQTQEMKSRPTCKLTELADIALGHDDKPDAPPAVAAKISQSIVSNTKRVVTPEYVTLSVVDGRKVDGGNFGVAVQDNNKKTTTAETQGSTSSKTIMHSSIIKAAVEEHGKAQATNKIVIPERPFKNIGLEEKETITFQKPKTTAVNLLINDDDNSVSTASYSDRDDFDFNSMSCDDDASVKNSNEKNLKSNSSDSSSSRATAKTFENKSLIMGRIFKNASTKAKPAAVKSVGVQKDHTPKADLNQLFDELRGGDAKVAKIRSPEMLHAAKDLVVAAQTKDVLIPNANKPNSIENAGPKITTQETKRKAATKAVPKKATTPKPIKKPQKDMSKLQTELGMSQEEIEKLIDEGQRKSKRRCATNRSKKLVETWSSDEYEEFLSTKDIIALIEENEKKEQRRKRKNSVGGEINQKSMLTTAAITPAESSTRKSVIAAPTVAEVRKSEEKNSKNAVMAIATVKEKDNTRQSYVSAKESTGIGAKTKSAKVKPTDESTSTSKATASKRGRKPAKNTKHTPNRGHKPEPEVNSDEEAEEEKEKKQVTSKKSVAAKSLAPTESSAAASETDDNLYLLDIKRNINNNINSNSNKKNRTKKDKSAVKESSVKEAKEDVTVNSCKPQSRETLTNTAEVIETKKRNVSTSGGGIGSGGSGSVSVSGVNSKKNKSKRKPQAEKSPARKRKAAEKLYYWSSSSDEEFGRINEHEPEFENTEQYQKHGWIVGDSHKKLVTLLAIAKGNKKQVENCGVKKNVSKRKN